MNPARVSADAPLCAAEVAGWRARAGVACRGGRAVEVIAGLVAPGWICAGVAPIRGHQPISPTYSEQVSPVSENRPISIFIATHPHMRPNPRR